MSEIESQDSSRVWRPHGFHFCELHNAIARFYMREEEFFHRQQAHYCGFMPEKAVGYYIERVYEDAETIARFGLAACLGEARHFHHRIYLNSWRYVNKSGLMGQAFQRAKPAHEWIRRQAARYCMDIRLSAIPVDAYSECSRTSWFRCWLPVSAWIPFLDNLELVFDPLLWGHPDSEGVTSYGGGRWQKGVQALKKVVKALESRSVSNVVISLDSFVNLCHNGGYLLNKFDCGRGLFTMCQVLNAKQRGHSLILALLRRSVCRDPEVCGKKVGIVPERVYEEDAIEQEEKRKKEEQW